MAIDSISISQDNKVNGSNLLPVHSTLVFLADVVYTGAYPTSLYVDVIVDSEVVSTFDAIPYRDLLANTRQFLFVANDVIKGLMESFDDVQQLTDTVAYVDDITKLATLRFRDSDNALIYDEVVVDFIHGAAQFGENPNLDAIFNNEDDIYFAPDGAMVYVYFYNDDINNVITIGTATIQTVLAQDSDDEIFTDYDDEEFEINVQL